MCHTCQKGHDNAEGHEAGLESLGGCKSWMELDECVNNCVYKCKNFNSRNDCSVDVDKLGS